MAPTPEPSASNVTERRIPVKRKRESARSSTTTSRTNTPNAYSRRSPPRPAAPPQKQDEGHDSDGDNSPPRKLKRPGAGARINRDAVEAARRKREEDERRADLERQNKLAAVEQVANHYNAVPERGREWRQTDSKIKGLRSLNNWIKSTLIQKFSRPDGPVQHFCVLDMACGKGGDLGKWEKAPLVPTLYVGCDIADVSIQQARSRYEETLRRNNGRHRRQVQMQAEFYVQDTFGRSLGEIQRVRQVGFNPNAGPGSGVIQPGMMSGGFDVVSMMFALHYSFESEILARGMLKNVAGALKKGGRFIGVMPNSDVISATMKKMLVAESKGKTPNGKASPEDPNEKAGSEDGEVEQNDEEDDWDPEKPSDPTSGAAAEDDDDWDPEKPSEKPAALNGTQNEDNWDPTKPSEPTPLQADSTSPAQQQNTPLDPSLPPLEWGNQLYTVRFPRAQPLTLRPLPRDGVFRPPYGWKYHYQLEEAVDVPEFVVPWEGFRALAEDYGLELMYRKGFKEVLDEIWDAGSADDGVSRGAGGYGQGGMQRELAMLAERMGVLSRDRSEGRRGLLVGDEEMEAAAFYHAFCFYRT